MSSTKIIEFDNIKFPKSISSKMVFEGEFLEIDSISMFSKKKRVIQKREFFCPFLQSISYNNAIVTKQIYFSPFFKFTFKMIDSNL